MELKKYQKALIFAYIAPFLFYFIPAIDFIPEIKHELVNILSAIFVIIFISYSIIIYTYWQYLDKALNKFFSILISLSVFLIHCYLITYILFDLNFSLVNRRVSYTKDFENRRVYVIKKNGLLNSYFGAEIGYRKGWSPFYKLYYQTKNHIEIVYDDSYLLVLHEYSYLDGGVDTTAHRVFFEKHLKIKNKIKEIKIYPEKLR